MVKFSVFNELSLPLISNQNVVEIFLDFFKLLEETKKKGLDALRLSKNFKNYEILPDINFQQFIGQQPDRDFQRKTISVLANDGVVLFDSPIIKKEENQELDVISGSEYFYNAQATDGGLACCDIWNTLAISFNSHTQWNADNICLEKQSISDEGDLTEQSITIKHASQIQHLDAHNDYFFELEQEIKLNITQKAFWEQKEISFPDIIIFCPEVKSQINELNKPIFQQAISILRDIETQRKSLGDYTYSGESETVRNSDELKRLRSFTINGKKEFFEKHIKNLPNGFRIYFSEKNNHIYIGYIGKHL